MFFVCHICSDELEVDPGMEETESVCPTCRNRIRLPKEDGQVSLPTTTTARHETIDIESVSSLLQGLATKTEVVLEGQRYITGKLVGRGGMDLRGTGHEMESSGSLEFHSFTQAPHPPRGRRRLAFRPCISKSWKPLERLPRL